MGSERCAAAGRGDLPALRGAAITPLRRTHGLVRANGAGRWTRKRRKRRAPAASRWVSRGPASEVGLKEPPNWPSSFCLQIFLRVRREPEIAFVTPRHPESKWPCIPVVTSPEWPGNANYGVPRSQSHRGVERMLGDPGRFAVPFPRREVVEVCHEPPPFLWKFDFPP